MRLMQGSFAMLILGRRNKQLSQVAACHGRKEFHHQSDIPRRGVQGISQTVYIANTSPADKSQVLASSTQCAVGQSGVKANDWALGLSIGGVWEARGFGSICARWPLSGTTSGVSLARPCSISLEDVVIFLTPARIDSASNAQNLVFAATKHEPASHYTLFSSALT
jgi:hypothetical protein